MSGRVLRFIACGGLVLAALVSAAPGQMTPEQRQAVLREAQQAYDAGVAALRTNPAAARDSFRQSATRFDQLLDDGVVNGHLHYNLANAFLQAGELGRAILHYRAAQQLRPGDPDIAHNLDYARSLCRSRIEPAGRHALARALLGWHRNTSTRGRFIVFATTYGFFWIALTMLLLRPGAAWRWTAGSCAVLWLACGASVAADELGVAAARPGVVLADEVIVRKGNGEGFDPQFEQPLTEGVEFEVREERGGWLRIELADGNSGWVPSQAVGLVG